MILSKWPWPICGYTDSPFADPLVVRNTSIEASSPRTSINKAQLRKSTVIPDQFWADGWTNSFLSHQNRSPNITLPPRGMVSWPRLVHVNLGTPVMKQNLRGTLLFTATEASKGLNPKRVDSRYSKISCFTIIFPHISKGTPPVFTFQRASHLLLANPRQNHLQNQQTKHHWWRKKQKNRPIKSPPKQKKRRSMKVPLCSIDPSSPVPHCESCRGPRAIRTRWRPESSATLQPRSTAWRSARKRGLGPLCLP